MVFVVIPIVLVAGLGMVPVGIFLARRRARQRLAEQIVDRKVAIRRMVWFLGVVTLINVVVGTQGTYRAVEHMESVQFCGQTCHVMTPEFRAHAVSPHARVQCVECHVGEGARGWVESKMSGTRQLIEVIFNSYPRPIPSAIETDRLVPARETCEKCHWPEKFVSARLRVIPKFAEDEANTASQTVLMMMVGGSLMPGIHGSHFGPGIEIRYRRLRQEAAEDPVGGVPQHQERGDALLPLPRMRRAGVEKDLPHYTMQCVDCHNRPTHAFDLPDRAVDKAMTVGLLPTTLPFLKKKGVELLKAKYASSEEAERRIPAELAVYYRQAYPTVASEREADVAAAAEDARAHLQHERLPGPGGRLGPVSEQPGPRGVSRLLPLPRRRAQGRRRKDHHAGLRRVPRDRGHGGELSGSAQDPRARGEDPGPPEEVTDGRGSLGEGIFLQSQ